MKVTVLFFGATADIVRKRQVDLFYKEPPAVADILDRLLNAHPSLRTRSLLSAVNQEYVNDKSELKDGDELAIFTAVSGG